MFFPFVTHYFFIHFTLFIFCLIWWCLLLRNGNRLKARKQRTTIHLSSTNQLIINIKKNIDRCMKWREWIETLCLYALLKHPKFTWNEHKHNTTHMYVTRTKSYGFILSLHFWKGKSLVLYRIGVLSTQVGGHKGKIRRLASLGREYATQ